jgi:predicted nucleic acid-binding protein
MIILLDASLFCSYFNVDDVFNNKSIRLIKDILSGMYGKPVITDYIFDEVISVIMRKCGKERALIAGNYLLNSSFMLIHIDKSVFDQAWEIFNETQDFSFTDCTILAFLRLNGITKLATFDKAFEKISDIEIIK